MYLCVLCICPLPFLSVWRCLSTCIKEGRSVCVSVCAFVYLCVLCICPLEMFEHVHKRR